MHRHLLIGPSVQDLRPVKKPAPGAGFPIFDNLERILAGAKEPDPLTGKPFDNAEVERYVCAVLSAWVYSDLETVAMVMTRLGLERTRCRSIELSNHAMLTRSTAYLIQSHDRKVALLAYRGTDPFDLSTWAVSGDVNPQMVGWSPKKSIKAKSEAFVHAGFYRNQRATWFEIVGALQRAIDEGDIFRANERNDVHVVTLDGDKPSDPFADQPNKLERLFVTGHSLGAAMALIAGFRIATEDKYEAIDARMRHIHAFAPPCPGDAAFAEHFAKNARERASCYVYKKDVVPRLPPHVPGGVEFAHVGKFFEVPSKEEKSAEDCSWSATPKAPTLADSPGQLLLAFTAAFGEKLDILDAFVSVLRTGPELLVKAARFFLSDKRLFTFYDHLPHHYVAVSQLENRKNLTELGGDF